MSNTNKPVIFPPVRHAKVATIKYATHTLSDGTTVNMVVQPTVCFVAALTADHYCTTLVEEWDRHDRQWTHRRDHTTQYLSVFAQVLVDYAYLGKATIYVDDCIDSAPADMRMLFWQALETTIAKNV